MQSLKQNWFFILVFFLSVGFAFIFRKELNDNSGVVAAIATLVAPLIALHIQKLFNLRDEEGHRKKYIYKTLMATRASRLSHEHVQALNMIDIEFCGVKIVTDAWASYRDHLSNPSSEEGRLEWLKKGDEFFVDLLHSMSQYFGYPFNKVDIKKGFYYPIAHGALEKSLHENREALGEILSGKAHINVALINLEATKAKGVMV